jgi:hypothetical protein
LHRDGDFSYKSVQSQKSMRTVQHSSVNALTITSNFCVSPENLRNLLRAAMSADLEILPARPRGRPTLYHAAHCERVLELASQGCCRAEIAADLCVSRKTLAAWANAHPEFRDALGRAKDLEYAWWLKAGREGQFIKGWNAASWVLQMRNRFGQRFRGAELSRGGEPKEATNAGRLRDEMERKLARIADTGAEEEVPSKPDTGGAGNPQL